MNSLPTIALFPTGGMVATPGALALLKRNNKAALEFLSRHLRGDWGELCQDDKTENELSLKYGFRLMSSYQITETHTLHTSYPMDAHHAWGRNEDGARSVHRNGTGFSTTSNASPIATCTVVSVECHSYKLVKPV